MSERHPIDELFRKQLDERKPEFDDAYWQEAKQLLNAHTATSLSLAKWKLFSVVAGVLLVSGAIGFYIGINRQPVKDVQQTVSVPEPSNSENVPGTNSTSTYSSRSNSNPQTQPTAKNGVVDDEQQEPETEANLNSKDVAALQQSSAEDFSDSHQHTDTKPARKKLPSSNTIEPEPASVIDDLPSAGQETLAPAKTTAGAASVAAVADAGEEQQAREDHNSGKVSQGFTPASHLSISKNQYSKLAGESTHPFMPPLTVPPFSISREQQPAEVKRGSPYSLSGFMKSNHWSKVKSFEFSATGGVAIVTVPATNSSATGFEWNALLHYRVNNWLVGAGAGQFAVKDQVDATEDSVTSGSIQQPIITTDSTWVVDSFFVIIDSMWVLMYDTSLQVNTDTSYEQITVYDTITHTYSVSSSGRYFEIPVIIGYRFPVGKSRLQVTGGAAYGWYSGGLRYGISSEGQLISYKPGAVVSLIGRLTWQYPIRQKLFLQAYTGARYVIGLNKDLPDENYLLYSFGAGLLYRF